MISLGIVAGLGAAIFWSLASVLYSRVPIGAAALTTIKNAVASVFLFAALVVSTSFHGVPLFQAPRSAWMAIAISGVIGLWLSDIAFFRSIQILGARRGLALTLLTPPTTATLGVWWLGDVLSVVAWSCILVSMVGIGIVMRERSAETGLDTTDPGSVSWGITCGLLGVGTMAVACVILKFGTQEVDGIEGTFIRLFSASFVGLAFGIPVRQFRDVPKLLADRRGMIELAVAILFGTVIGVYLMLLAYKYCETAGLAATLTSMSPLFVIPILYFGFRQPVTRIAIVGAVVAFAGVCGLLLRG